MRMVSLRLLEVTWYNPLRTLQYISGTLPIVLGAKRCFITNCYYWYHCYSMISILANSPLLTMPSSYRNYIMCPLLSKLRLCPEARRTLNRGSAVSNRGALGLDPALPGARKFSAAGRGFPGYWTPENGQTWPKEVWAKCVLVTLTHPLCPVCPPQALPPQGSPNQKRT